MTSEAGKVLSARKQVTAKSPKLLSWVGKGHLQVTADCEKVLSVVKIRAVLQEMQ